MKLKAKKLTPENFAPYGSYFNMHDVDSERTGNLNYYPDKASLLFDHSQSAGLSVCGINKHAMTVPVVEIHEHTEEAEFLINADSAFLVGKRSGLVPDMKQFEAFIAPKGTAIRFKKMVWHYIPFPLEDVRLMVLTVLPPFTYTQDVIVETLPEPFEIEV